MESVTETTAMEMPHDSSLEGRSPVMPDRLLPGLETLVSRGLVYLVLLCIIAAVIWMARTEVDVVVQARGRIAAEGEPVEISPPNGGIVVELPVTVGQSVAAGDVLFRIDDFEDRAEVVRLAAEIEVLETREQSRRRRAGSLESTIAWIDEELRSLKQQVVLAEAVVDRRRRLKENGSVSSEEVEQKKAAVLALRARVSRVEVEKKQLAVEASTQHALAAECAAERFVLEARRAQAGERIVRCVVTAPVAGVVSSLAVAHPGAALVAGEVAVEILPAESPFMVKVEIPNGSMRHIRAGADARIELDAFPGEDYGFLDGEVVRIDPDANERGNYEAWVSLGTQDGAGAGEAMMHRAGLAAEVRIINDRRTLLRYLLNPLTRIAERGLSVGE